MNIDQEIKIILESTSRTHLGKELEKSTAWMEFRKTLPLDFVNVKNIQILYHIENNLPFDIPLCPECNKPLGFHSGYKKFCSRSCRAKYNHKEFRIKLLNDHGVENISQLQSIKDKKKETSLRNWGVDNPSKNKEIRIIISNTYQTKTNEEKEQINLKREETNERLFGNRFSCNVEKIRDKQKETLKETHGVSFPFCSPIIQEKISEIIKDRYNVDNIAQHREIIDRIRSSKIKNGVMTEKTEKRELYYDLVKMISERSFREHYHIINPMNMKRGPDYHLDHIFSIHYGFLYGISPEIIGHHTNLRIIPANQNTSKSLRCDKTFQELMDDFYQSSI